MNDLLNHLWQSTLFAAVAGLLTLVLRRIQARTRYWLWFAASAKFLMPFSVLVALGSQIEWRKAPAIAQPTVFFTVEQISQPFRAASVAAAPKPGALPITAVLFAVWALRFLLVVVNWSRKWARMHAAVRAASDLPLPFPVPVKSSSALIEPGVFGILRPVLVLPEGISDRLTPAQLEAILAHELCHVRHRDNLAAAIHMLVEAIFWFHPLVWWIGARMVEERERACDEEVLRLGSDPEVYAEGILRVCEFYLESPLTCVAGVTGSDLKKRVERIMQNCAAETLGRTKKIVLMTAGAAAIVVPVLVGVLTAPPRLLAQSLAAGPKFEVAAIKPSEPGEPGKGFHYESGSRVIAQNATLHFLIQEAYRVRDFQVTGGPAWIDDERYDIRATGFDGSRKSQLLLMTQALLADRFQLKLHRETKVLPVYYLTPASGGMRLSNPKDDACAMRDSDASPSNYCGMMVTSPNGLDASKIGMQQITIFLSDILGRSVIDRTGFKGSFDVHLEVTRNEALRATIFDALEKQLGLKLESSKGPVEVLVIDHVERPSPN